MQENYEKWKIIQKELHIQKCNFMWEEIENDEGRNIKHHRKKNTQAHQRSEKWTRISYDNTDNLVNLKR